MKERWMQKKFRLDTHKETQVFVQRLAQKHAPKGGVSELTRDLWEGFQNMCHEEGWDEMEKLFLHITGRPEKQELFVGQRYAQLRNVAVVPQGTSNQFFLASASPSRDRG